MVPLWRPASKWRFWLVATQLSCPTLTIWVSSQPPRSGGRSNRCACSSLIDDVVYGGPAAGWSNFHPSALKSRHAARITRSALRFRRVDAINAFGVSAGHFASFGVVSRRQIPASPGRRVSRQVRFPAAPLNRRWSTCRRRWAGSSARSVRQTASTALARYGGGWISGQ